MSTTEATRFKGLVQGVLDHVVASTTCVQLILYTGKAITSPTDFAQCIQDFSDQVRSHLSRQTLNPGTVMSDYTNIFNKFRTSVLFFSRALYHANSYMDNRFRDMESNRNRAASKKDADPNTLPPVPVRRTIQLICYQLFNEIILEKNLSVILDAFMENVNGFRSSDLTDMDHPLTAAFMDPLRSVVSSIVLCGEILCIPDFYVTKIKDPVFQAVTDFYSGKGVCIEKIHEYITIANDWITKERKLCDTVILAEFRSDYTDTVCDLIINEKLSDILSVNILSFTTPQLTCVYNLMSYASRKETLYQSFNTGVMTSITERIAAEIAKNPNDMYKTNDIINTFISTYSEYTLIISVAFSGDPVMFDNLVLAMRATINRNNVNTEQRPDAVAILLSKYVHWLLTNTTMDPAELDSMLLMSSKMYDFIEGKDVFHVYFKVDFKTRTLEQKSTSDDHELRFISYITPVCVDPSFLRDISLMRADYVNSKGLANKYVPDPTSQITMDPLIVSPSVWPFAKTHELRCNVPEVITSQLARFEEYYKGVFGGTRDITWLHEHSSVKSNVFINGKKYTIKMTMFQAILLEILFRDLKAVKLSILQDIIGLPEEYIFATVMSLAGTGLIQRNPSNAPLSRDTLVRINPKFENKGRIMNAAVRYRTPKAQDVDPELEQQIARDRENTIKCAIVRIMKARKSLDVDTLVSETILQTFKHFNTSAPAVRRQLEVLVNMPEHPPLATNDSRIYNYLA